ncbi:MAG TPA: hypothetical protein P5277_00810 [Candidatus Paceibacterota bacterium]|nr:hypothetical protein [Candidatus Paceibacterota bacterium]
MINKKNASLINIIEIEKAPCCSPTNSFSVWVLDENGKPLQEGFVFTSSYNIYELNSKKNYICELFEESSLNGNCDKNNKHIFAVADNKEEGEKKLYQRAYYRANELANKYRVSVFDFTRRNKK